MNVVYIYCNDDNDARCVGLLLWCLDDQVLGLLCTHVFIAFLL